MMNILHIVSDQHQAACAGYEGHPQALTPNLDHLAATGMRFSNAYCQNPICTPSRVSMLSGQYCHNHGYFGLGGPTPGHHGTPLLPNWLGHFRRHGYRTAAIGKLHLPDDPHDWLLPDVHFWRDCYRSANGEKPGAFFDHLRSLDLLDKEDSVALPDLPGRQQHEARPSALSYEHSVEGWCVREAMDFINRCEDQPWCMQVSLPRPHQCYTPDRRFWDMYPEDLDLPPGLHADATHRPPHFQAMVDGYRKSEGQYAPREFELWARRVWRGYLACITQVDHAVGELLGHLDAMGQADRTVVVYNSDHGAYSGTFGVPEKAPGICSDMVCRVPLLWRVPGVTAAGSVSKQLVELVDLADTFTSLCDLPAMPTTDGQCLADLLAGGDEPVRDVAVTENPWSKSIRFGDWRFVHYQPAMFEKDVGELYYLGRDPNETTNLYDEPQQQPVVQQARQLLLQWLIQTTRVRTTHPPIRRQADGTPGESHAADGALPNTCGPHQCVVRGKRNYI